MNKKNIKGISVIEILIVAAFIAVGFTGILGVISYSLKISTSTKEIVQANNLAQEAIEAVRNFRDGTDWNTDGLKNYVPVIATSSAPYHLELNNNFSPPKWALATGTESIYSFTRAIIFEKVSRDGEKNIEEIYNSVNDDPNTRKMIITVAWEGKEVRMVTYLTNWR